MVKIPGFVYFIIGVGVAAASWKLDFKKFQLFFILAIIFIFIGVAKMIVSAKRKAPTPVRGGMFCRTCASPLHPGDRFCPNCGGRA